MTATIPPAAPRSGRADPPRSEPTGALRGDASTVGGRGPVAGQLRTLLLGLGGSLLLAVFALGGGGVLMRDPVLGDGPLSWIRYGHGRDLSVTFIYVGVALLIWAWVRLGRAVLARAAGRREVLWAAGLWIAPMVFSAPVFTRDVYSYLGQGALALAGLDPYQVGPVELPPGPVADNVHYFWQTTPAPYGPFFLAIAQAVHAVTGGNLIAGVIGLRLALLVGLALLVYALPRLAEHMGGRESVALWLVVANPMMVVHLVGGPHNDLLMIGLLATGTLLMLRGRCAGGVALVTVAAAVKATALMALPLLVWIWAARLPGSPLARFAKAVAASVTIFVVVFCLIMLGSGLNLGWVTALHAPSLNINWMSLPTALGLIVEGAIRLVSEVDDRQPILDITRLIGGAVLAAFVARQWWKARHGGIDVVRRVALVMLAVALLSPINLPWYLSWALALAAGLAWSPRTLTWMVGASAWLVLASWPDGENAIDTLPYVVVTVLAAALAGYSLTHPDPLRLGRRHNGGSPLTREPAGAPDPAPDPARGPRSDIPTVGAARLE